MDHTAIQSQVFSILASGTETGRKATTSSALSFSLSPSPLVTSLIFLCVVRVRAKSITIFLVDRYQIRVTIRGKNRVECFLGGRKIGSIVAQQKLCRGTNSSLSSSSTWSLSSSSSLVSSSAVMTSWDKKTMLSYESYLVCKIAISEAIFQALYKRPSISSIALQNLHYDVILCVCARKIEYLCSRGAQTWQHVARRDLRCESNISRWRMYWQWELPSTCCCISDKKYLSLTR